MQATMLLIRFGELNTKGKNKNDFINQLYENIVFACKQVKPIKVNKNHDRIYISYTPENEEILIKKIKKVSGISSFSKVYEVEKDIDKICDSCLELVKDSSYKTFKVKANRADKNFPIHSDDVNRIVATKILKNTEIKVDVHEPDVLVSIDIREEGSFIYTDKIKGSGGYPMGVAGKGMLMMSGGLDSPIACHLAMNRGLKVECIHFASPPYTQPQAVEKVIDLLKVLSKDKLPVKLHIVPFTKLQEAIYENVDESYCITIMRRMMYRIAAKLAHRRNCLCIINGESIGQVASQTLPSMAAINEVVKIPVIRPLACIDKEWIMDKAKEIGTFDISIRPYTDCCTIFTPHNPVTRPDARKCEEYEKKFDYETLVNECVHNVESISIDENYGNASVEEYF